MLSRLLHALRRLLRPGTPEEAGMAEQGAQDADAGVWAPPARPDLRRAYKRGWTQAQGRW